MDSAETLISAFKVDLARLGHEKENRIRTFTSVLATLCHKLDNEKYIVNKKKMVNSLQFTYAIFIFQLQVFDSNKDGKLQLSEMAK